MGACASRPEGCVCLSSKKKKKEKKNDKQTRTRRRRIIKRRVSSRKIDRAEFSCHPDRSFTNPAFQGLNFPIFIVIICKVGPFLY